MIPILYFYSISKKLMAAWRHGGMVANAPLPGGYSPATRHLQPLYPPPTGPVPGGYRHATRHLTTTLPPVNKVLHKIEKYLKNCCYLCNRLYNFDLYLTKYL